MKGASYLELIFAYPPAAHVRQHGPQGYTDYGKYKPWLRDKFTFRCVYCLWRERWAKEGAAIFSIDHVIARTVAPERSCDYENLVYACAACNSSKQAEHLPDPCRESFATHLRVRADGVVEGLTKAGLRMVALLHLNRDRALEFRRRLLNTLRCIEQAGEAVPFDIVRQWLSYPDDLPNLARLRPPRGSSRPAGVWQSHFQRRRQGRLPDIY
jgi:hypothetical protein